MTTHIRRDDIGQFPRVSVTVDGSFNVRGLIELRDQIDAAREELYNATLSTGKADPASRFVSQPGDFVKVLLEPPVEPENTDGGF